tara:strand:- start:379 stop:1428 length:1050 start_codon:yes stop_codon:yes gene_type:complete
MMQTFTNLAQRSDELWQQRLALCTSDYITLAQLQRHDRQLLQSVRLCQRYLSADDAGMPAWLSAILNDSAAELNMVLTLPLALPAQRLVAEIWLALRAKTAEHYRQQFNRPEQSQLLCLLCNKALATGLFQQMWHLDQRSAVQLAGQFGLVEQVSVLQSIAGSRSLNAASLAELRFSLYLLGQQTDVVGLTEQLLSAQCLQPRQLQLLLLAATRDQKIRIINLLCLVDYTLALNAMGFSGLTKFCPLLLDIARQPELKATAQSALITMYGPLTADNLLNTDQPVDQSAAYCINAVLVGGQAVETLNTALLWATGNHYHRFAAAALHVLQQPGLALAEPHNWRGGEWPVA